MSLVPEERRVIRFFTSTRRIPVMLGKINGARIPFGPYTLMQILIGAATFFVGYQLMPLWGPLLGGTSPLVWILALVFITAGVTWASGRIPSTRRHLQNIVMDAAGAATVSSAGTYKDRAIKLPPPHRVTGSVLLPMENASAPQPAPTASPLAAPNKPMRPQPAPVVTPPRAGFETGLDRLLAQARAGKDD